MAMTTTRTDGRQSSNALEVRFLPPPRRAGLCSPIESARSTAQTSGMARYRPQRDPFRCHAVMPDGSVTILFASTATPETALEIVRATFHSEGVQPAKIQIYRSGKDKPRGAALLEWNRR